MTTEIYFADQNNTEVNSASSSDELISINNKISYFEDQINRTSAGIVTRRVGSFGYFCPYFVVSIIVGFFGFLFISIENFMMQASGDPNHAEFVAVAFLTLVVVFAIIHVIGGFFARNKQYKVNLELDRKENEARDQIKLYQEQYLKLNMRKKELLGQSSEAAVGTAQVIPEDIMNAIAAKKTEIENNEKAIEALKYQIRKLQPGGVSPKRSSFHYFWPFLVVSLVAVHFMYMASYMIDLSFLHLDYPVVRGFETAVGFLIYSHVFVLLHVFGGMFARRKRDKFNKAAAEKDSLRINVAGKLRDEMANLEYQKQKLYEELRSYEESARLA